MPGTLSSYDDIREEVWLHHWKKLLRVKKVYSLGQRSLVYYYYVSIYIQLYRYVLYRYCIGTYMRICAIAAACARGHTGSSCIEGVEP